MRAAITLHIDRPYGLLEDGETLVLASQQHVEFKFIAARRHAQQMRDQRRRNAAEAGLCISKFLTSYDTHQQPSNMVAEPASQWGAVAETTHSQNQRASIFGQPFRHKENVIGVVLPVCVGGD